jgi:UDP-glucuronate decarboxylase
MKIEDLKSLKENPSLDWEAFNGKNVYITGATGLLGTSLVESLLFCSNAKVTVQVRNEEKARKLFADRVEYVICDLSQKPEYAGNVDYIIHCANPTSSKFFINNPVETIQTAVNGSINVLEFAKEKLVSSFVFLSTMEIYGTPEQGHKVREAEGGSFDSSVVRNCYPLSKQTCESLCAAYASEYGIPAKVVRLTQTFGPGVEYNDGRVFAEFARCAIEKKNIVLKTKGETERDYLYTADAVSAILTVLLKGKKGECYTAANEATFCSIYEMAKLVADANHIEVVIEEQDISKMGYANTLHMDLDTAKLRALGWEAKTDLKTAFQRLIEDMTERRNVDRYPSA